MLTRRIEDALDSLWVCRERLPMLRDLFRDGSPERAALDDAIRRADKVMCVGKAASPAERD